jgi:ATP-dependent helicase/nuclease subunit A
MAKWTTQQRQAIDTDGRDILVTASAGTGKTSVLAGRCMRLLSDAKSGTGVRQMLVLTFTNAAAEEMRSRIAGELRKECDSTGSRHLRHQVMLIDAADIGTIHSFCQRLIREHFYLAGIDPAVRLIDEDEQRLLKSQMLERTVEWAWRQSSLVESLGEFLTGRNISAKGHSFLEHVLGISNFLDGVADRSDWCARAVAANDLPSEAGAAVAARQKEIIKKKLSLCREQLLFAISVDERLTGGYWRDQITATRLSYIDEGIACLRNDNMAGFAAVVDGFVAGKRDNRLANRPRGMSDADRDLIHDPITKAMDAFVGLRSLAVVTPAYRDLAGQAIRRQTSVLVELVRQFDLFYQDAKKKANCLDFADLEHLALRLLEGKAGPSEVALKLRSRYKAVFVDEYQDINRVQKRLLSLLTAGRNVFAVGDVKQSIYAFRGAVPDIFLDDLSNAEKRPADIQRIDLTGNFRSRQEVLDFVNTVFGRIMTGEMAGLDYDSTAMLTGELPYLPLEGPGRPVELNLFDRSSEKEPEEEQAAESDSPGDELTQAQMQAARIAERIRQMVGADTGKAEFNIFDKQEQRYRPVEYRDIVILMRSLGSTNDYAEVLSLAEIPVHSQSTSGYFAATEVSDSLALLKVLDNPQRDIEFAAVLRSPMFSVSDTDLLRIRLFGSGKSSEQKAGFYECFRAYVSDGPEAELKARLAEIQSTLQQWRELAMRGSIADMLWRAYRQRGYLSFVAALPRGRQRRANLLDLHSRAVQFAGFATTPGTSLGAFVEFAEKMLDEGADYKPADVMGPGENAVRIMSVHKSKGLEFPVVFLAGIEKRFNFQDASGECLFDEATTLGLSMIDKGRNARLRSMTGEVIAARKMAMGLAEEMRILYVALTRARERLILTAAQRLENCRKVLRNGAAVAGDALPEWMLASCRTDLDWILLGLSRCPEIHKALATEVDCPGTAAPLMDVHVLGGDAQDRLAQWVASMRKGHDYGSGIGSGTHATLHRVGELVRAVTDSLKWQYPYLAATDAAAKTSVTELTHHGDEFQAIDYSRAYERVPLAVAQLTDGRIESRTLGTATHLVIQSLDLAQPASRDSVQNTVNRLVQSGALAQEVASGIDVAAIAGFLQSEVGSLMRANSDRVMREWPFTFAIPLAEYEPSAEGAAADDSVIVQGIIDMLLPLPDRLVIVDFKTDRIPKAMAAHRAEMYRPQLSLYARAAKTILSATASEQWLYFLSCSTAVRVG